MGQLQQYVGAVSLRLWAGRNVVWRERRWSRRAPLYLEAWRLRSPDHAVANMPAYGLFACFGLSGPPSTQTPIGRAAAVSIFRPRPLALQSYFKDICIAVLLHYYYLSLAVDPDCSRDCLPGCLAVRSMTAPSALVLVPAHLAPPCSHIPLSPCPHVCLDPCNTS